MVDFKGLHRILYDLSVDFAEVDKALGAVVHAAVSIGDEYVLGEMSSLAFGVQGQCTGVALEDGGHCRRTRYHVSYSPDARAQKFSVDSKEPHAAAAELLIVCE
ncbi:hypothetical protein BFJ70_g16580 [Fusarium oxysporum]|nr:hypothetical protein BFJ70_g16580 [Fusarium oxysporum]